MQSLTSDQLRILARIVADESGPDLTRGQFADSVLQMFEHISGFEHVSQRQLAKYVRTMWITYKKSNRQPTKG